MPNLQAAKPIVRLKCPNGTYKEIQEGELFEANGGKPEDLLDDERWLRSPTATEVIPIQARTTPVKYRPNQPPLFFDPQRHKGTRGDDATFKDRSVWEPLALKEQSTVRNTTSGHVVFKLVARACRDSDSIVDKFPSTRLGPGDIQGVFVGISAIDFLPMVLTKSPEWNRDAQENTDGLGSVKLENSCDASGGREIIWLENMLIPGNIAHVKSALFNTLADSEKEHFMRVAKRENSLLRRGLSPAGVAKVLPSSESPDRKPAICRSIHNGQSYDTLHYILRWPPMAVLTFPPEMIEEMKRFLRQYPHDNVPLNIALAAAIIHTDLADEGWPNEGFLSHRFEGPKAIKPTPLARFILYFPHMLRYVETKHLTAFIHPARFATYHSNRDPSVYASSINQKEMKTWCSQIRSRYPQVSSKCRLNLIPASMPGTQMVFPADCTSAEPPTTDLFQICCLDDIRTLGLPSYHHNKHYDLEDHGKFRYIGGPTWLFSKHLNRATYALAHTLGVNYWLPSSDTRIMTLSGPAKKVGPVFRDLPLPSNDNALTGMTQAVQRRFGIMAPYTKDYDYQDSISSQTRKKRSSRANELFRVARYMEIPIDHLRLCPKSGYPTWEGMESQLKNLAKDGLLDGIINGDGATPTPKRPRTSERKLDDSVKAKIEGLLGSAAAVSRDWEALRVYLQGSELTIEGARKSLSQLQSFIASIEKEFCSENATNGRGNLKEVIRLTFRAAGLEPELALAACENKLACQKNMLAQLEQSVKQNIEHIYELQPLKNGFLYALPYVKALSDSPLIQGQSALLKEIDALLSAEIKDEP
ncbi:uncharacterized protein FIESC28_11724 [Fusarium coffeatum]|uniref:Uncharacterized protein n=1 Tax=Fusarium coffeatum TaxID=231269 RepID=A0A366QHS9_9HYPO|nr:uncharacterized protein FIESC28_11724 [Fusarium coffeatum]RBR03686.1 hypothetical protein FIESC28_11724 [Fusarium coffeatum]